MGGDGAYQYESVASEMTAQFSMRWPKGESLLDQNQLDALNALAEISIAEAVHEPSALLNREIDKLAGDPLVPMITTEVSVSRDWTESSGKIKEMNLVYLQYKACTLFAIHGYACVIAVNPQNREDRIVFFERKINGQFVCYRLSTGIIIGEAPANKSVRESLFLSAVDN